VLDVGDVYPIRIEVRDATGTLVDATGGVCVVTKPDGTSASVALTHVSTGVYEPQGVIDQVGRYLWTYGATSPQMGLSGVFEVDDASAGIVSLEDVKAHLNLSATQTGNDEELRSSILAASQWVESKIGPVTRRTFTQTFRRWGTPLVLDNVPVVSVTSVTPTGGVAYDALLLDVDLEAGLIYPAYGYRWPTWFYGTLVVEYVAGRAVVPALIQWAVKEFVAWLWDTQRGPAQASPVQADFADQLATGSFATVPHRIEQALQPYVKGSVVA
jgi:hypothetical protein